MKVRFAVDVLEERKQRRRPHILTFEEDRVLVAAVPHIRALAVLNLETGMRSRREALSLLWSDVDLVNDIIRVRESKTRAGERTIPISDRCKAELLRWRNLVGPEFSSYVFLSTYARALDEYPRDAIHQLEDLRDSHVSTQKPHQFLGLWERALPRHWECSQLIATKRTGGEGGIRTPGTVSRTPVFKTGAFNHSATSPRYYSFTTVPNSFEGARRTSPMTSIDYAPPIFGYMGFQHRSHQPLGHRSALLQCYYKPYYSAPSSVFSVCSRHVECEISGT
jgi:hypothetical protein